ncbi:MAG: glutamate--tRNA ligase family protein, partial [Pseudomonadota bacterium]
MNTSFVTRFAPSPNGYLHLGHAFSALTAYAAAKDAGGLMLLRIDDIDTSRARSQYTGAIYEDLRWLGVHWPSPIRAQSNHLADYDAAAHELRERGLLYPCFCTRKTLRLTARGHYAGTCKALSKSDIER